MRVVAEVVEARISANLLAQVVHAIEDVRQAVALFDVRFGPQPEGALAGCAVVRLQKGKELWRGLLLAIPINGHRAVDLRPISLELRQLGEKRHARFREQLHLVSESLDRRLETRRHVAQLDETALKSHTLLAGLGGDLRTESQLRRLAGGVGCVA